MCFWLLSISVCSSFVSTHVLSLLPDGVRLFCVSSLISLSVRLPAVSQSYRAFMSLSISCDTWLLGFRAPCVAFPWSWPSPVDFYYVDAATKVDSSLYFTLLSSSVHCNQLNTIKRSQWKVTFSSGYTHRLKDENGERTRPSILYNSWNEPEMKREFRNSMKGNCECVSASQREKPWPEGWKMEKRLKRIIAGNIEDVVQSDGHKSCSGSVA